MSNYRYCIGVLSGFERLWGVVLPNKSVEKKNIISRKVIESDRKPNKHHNDQSLGCTCSYC